MDSYAYWVYVTGWPDAGAQRGRLDDNKPGNMSQHPGNNDQERQQNLVVFKFWAGNWTLRRIDPLTKEELAGIKAPH